MATFLTNPKLTNANVPFNLAFFVLSTAGVHLFPGKMDRADQIIISGFYIWPFLISGICRWRKAMTWEMNMALVMALVCMLAFAIYGLSSQADFYRARTCEPFRTDGLHGNLRDCFLEVCGPKISWARQRITPARDELNPVLNFPRGFRHEPAW